MIKFWTPESGAKGAAILGLIIFPIELITIFIFNDPRLALTILGCFVLFIAYQFITFIKRSKIIRDWYEFNPIKEWHSNYTLTAPDGNDDVLDLPATLIDNGQGDYAVISIWKVSGLAPRLKLLFTGKINFICTGKTHPPISLVVGEYLERVNK